MAITTGLEYKCNSIGTESSVSLAYVWGLEDHHPTMSMTSGLGGRSRRRTRKGKKRRKHMNKGDNAEYNGKEIGDGGGSTAVSDRNIRHKKYKTSFTLLDDRDQNLLKRGGPKNKSSPSCPMLFTF